MTKEQMVVFNRNRYHAVKYFEAKYDWYKNRQPREYILHHKDETLRHTDIERYIEWRIEDLEIMPYGEHSRLHMTGREVAEHTRQLISERMKGVNHKGENNPMWGKHPESWCKGKTKETDESLARAAKKLSDAKKGIQPKQFSDNVDNCKGSKWYNNGEVAIRLHENDIIPEGFVEGRGKIKKK